jgi:NAD-dependent deacetylase
MASLKPPPSTSSAADSEGSVSTAARPNLSSELAAALDRTAGAIHAARRLLCITGAGMSADAGLPTYRGVGGLYNRGLTEEGMSIEEALSGHTLETRPAVCWKHLVEIERAARGARPSRGHEVLAMLERSGREVWVLTQNVDGLHRAAGSRHVIDIHGDFSRLRCTGCGLERVVDGYADLEIPPHCHQCGGAIRPDVVLFGELLPADKVRTLQVELARGFDAVLSIGTSSLFPYIVEPVVAAARAGRFTAEINPAETLVSAVVDVRLPMGASAALGELAKRVELLGP